jgi:hypothetical protein
LFEAVTALPASVIDPAVTGRLVLSVFACPDSASPAAVIGTSATFLIATVCPVWLTDVAVTLISVLSDSALPDAESDAAVTDIVLLATV